MIKRLKFFFREIFCRHLYKEEEAWSTTSVYYIYTCTKCGRKLGNLQRAISK